MSYYPMEVDEDDGKSENLTVDYCEKICTAFVDITSTDSALAMFFLQDCQWNLQKALDKYYENSSPATSSNKRFSFHCKQKYSLLVLTLACLLINCLIYVYYSSLMNMIDTLPPQIASNAHRLENALNTSQKPRILVMSWNIDGLDENSLESRTRAAASTILTESPTVVLLQEVVKTSQLILEEMLSAKYQLLFAPVVDYYVAICLRRDHCHLESHEIIRFPTSRMGRALLCVRALVGKVPMLLISAHLESTYVGREERLIQLQYAFDLMEKEPAERTVLFGGDLNVRDDEVSAVKKSEQLIDLWQATGSRPHARYTWDTQRNSNAAQSMGREGARLRFDRFYLRHSIVPKLAPIYFELAGLTHLPNSQRFASDHWAILAHLDGC